MRDEGVRGVGVRGVGGGVVGRYAKGVHFSY